MAKAKFNLRNTKTDKETPIYLKFHYKKKVLTYSTDLKVVPAKWNFARQRFKGYSALAKVNNNHLDFLELTINSLFLELQQNGKSINIDILKTEFFKRLGKAKNDNTFITYAEKLDAQRKQSNIKSSLSLIIKHIKIFNKTLIFENINNDFYYNFIEYCFDKDFSRNYINKLLQKFKTVCNDAIKNKATENTDFKYFKRLKAGADKIYLTPKKISELYRYESKDKLKEAVKDWFVLACCLGLRHSDWHKVKKSNIKTLNDNLIFTIKDQKTDNYLAVPLNLFPYALPILKKYNFELPEIKYVFLINTIKEIAEEIGWIQVIEKTEYKKEIKVKTVRFCDEIGTHTARRSFVTNLKNRGFSNSDIMKMTGHKSTDSFNKYDKQTAEASAVLIAAKVGKLKAVK